MSQAEFHVASILSRPFAENTYVAWLAGRKDCLIVDPGFEPGKILRCCLEQGLTPAAILNTHGHVDHIAGNEAMKERWPDVPLIIGRIDAPMLTDATLNLSADFMGGLTSPPADRLLDDNEVFDFAGFTLETRWIPGHSPGHVVFVWHAGKPSVVFGGDVLMAGSIGRTDFPGGSFEQLADGIRRRLYDLPDDTLVLPGHGPETTTGEEKASNPFVRG
jgi:glyoxylase-like metal-dependent hydrolase (beta-lactamase superfamily II)